MGYKSDCRIRDRHTMLFAVILFALAFSGGDGSPTTKSVDGYDTIIVGLGSAGSTAASTLCKAGRHVLALEAQNRIGGRVHTVPFGDGIVEVGGEWIHGTEQSRVYELAIANNISIISDKVSPEFYRSDGSIANKTLVDELVNYGIAVTDEPPEKPEPVGQYVTRKLMEYIQVKYPQLLNDKDFIDEFLKFMDLLMNTIEGSSSWNDVSTAGHGKELKSNQAMSWHRYGYKTFFEILLNTYNGGPGFPNLDIKLNTEVTQIAWPQDPAADVIVTCKDGATYRARNVIVTVSLGVLKERHQTLFSPNLPQDKITAIEKISIGVLGKIIMSYKEPWWNRDLSYFGFIWKGADRLGVAKEDEWITRIKSVSVPTGSNNTLTLWVNGDVVDVVETLPEEELKRNVLGILKRFIGKDITIPEPTALIRSTWLSNPYTRGCYTYDNLLVTQYPNARSTLAVPLVDSTGKPRVLFAGEATNPTHFATVHGASETGYREAQRLLP